MIKNDDGEQKYTVPMREEHKMIFNIIRNLLALLLLALVHAPFAAAISMSRSQTAVASSEDPTKVLKAGDTMTGPLTISTNPSTGNALDVTGPVSLVGPLSVSSNPIGANGLDVTGSASIGGALGVSGTANIVGPVSVTSNPAGGNGLDVTGSAAVGGGLGVTGAATVGGTLDVTSNTTILGKASVGTASILNPQLSIIRTDGDLLRASTDTVSSGGVTISSDGAVLIGRSARYWGPDVSTFWGDGLEVQNRSISMLLDRIDSSMNIWYWGTSAVSTPNFNFRNHAGTQDSPLAIPSGTVIGRMRWRGYDGVALQEGARMEATAFEGYSPTNRATRWTVAGTPSGSTTRETWLDLRVNREAVFSSNRFRVSNPASGGDSFIVDLSTSAGPQMTMQNSAGNPGVFFDGTMGGKGGTFTVNAATTSFINSNNGNAGLNIISLAEYGQNILQSNAAVGFHVGGIDTTYPPLFIASDGKVGVGTSAPTERLECLNTIKAGGFKFASITTGKALCSKADSSIGYCSDAPDGTGSCTCN